MSHAHAFSCIHTFNTLYCDILLLVLFYLSHTLSFSLSLSRVRISLLLWHLNTNLLHPRTLCILGHLFPLILHHLLFGSVMRTFVRTSRRTFVDEAFIRNATTFYQTFLTLTYLLLFIVGVGSYFVASRSLAPP